MRNNKATQYAQALFLAGESKGGAEAKDIALGLVRAAEKRRETGLLRSILMEAERLLIREKKKDRVSITVAHERAVARYKKNIADGLRAFDAEKKEHDIIIDPSIIGGFHVSHKGMLYDASYRRRLLDLYRRLTT